MVVNVVIFQRYKRPTDIRDVRTTTLSSKTVLSSFILACCSTLRKEEKRAKESDSWREDSNLGHQAQEPKHLTICATLPLKVDFNQNLLLIETKRALMAFTFTQSTYMFFTTVSTIFTKFCTIAPNM